MREKIKENNVVSKASSKKQRAISLHNKKQNPPIFNGNQLHDSSIAQFEILADASEAIFNAINKKAHK